MEFININTEKFLLGKVGDLVDEMLSDVTMSKLQIFLLIY